MSWSETKKISDVIKSNSAPSEIISKTFQASEPLDITGSGILFFYTTGTLTIIVDGVELLAQSITVPNGDHAVIPFSKSLLIQSAERAYWVTVYLYDREFIGGGYRRKLVPFFSRKAVAA